LERTPFKKTAQIIKIKELLLLMLLLQHDFAQQLLHQSH
jgi:hypothetical protein